MTRESWREDDFEERGFDPRIFASTAANTWFVEKELRSTLSNQEAADIICVTPDGTLIALQTKVDPKTKYRCTFPYPQRAYGEKWVMGPRRLPASPSIVLSRLSIDEPLCQIERGASVSSSSTEILEPDERQDIEAIHPLTRSIYEQLPTISKFYREAIQRILSLFATSLSESRTNELPPLRLALLDDSSYLLEWTFEDRRLGFSFEPNAKDSGWYYVYSSVSSERYESGTMDQLQMNRLIEMMLKP